jgi:uncharacterized membrane protein
MFSSQLHYLPLSPTFFSMFAGVLLAVFILIQIGVLRYAYMRLGVNVGGALIPGVMSLYLLARYRLWLVGPMGIAIVAAVCHYLTHSVPGVGIALPVLVPAVTTAMVALLLSGRQAAPLAYASGSLGTLVGADLLNLDKLQGLGAPIASIGGAGTFDGIFLTGILAVLLASISRRAEPRSVLASKRL